jgi:hypothetical protein
MIDVLSCTRARPVVFGAALAIAVACASGLGAAAQTAPRPTIADAQQAYFNAQYETASALSVALREANPEDLAAIEVHTSALLFQIRAALRHQPDKAAALKQCATCGDLIKAFDRETDRGQEVARARLREAPTDEAALFFLGKIDLNHVWLYLGTLGQKTGWTEYWEARRSLDAVLARNPAHVRARVARAWIDYIIDTRMPRGTRWVLGGGNRKRALVVVQEAAAAEADRFAHAEAAFALWDMQLREKNVAEAIVTAQALAREFPDNRELTRFLEANGPASRRP